MSLVGKRALIAEEDTASAKVAAILLRQERCTTWVAASAEEALELYAQHHPDVVVLELVIPVMGGLELARRIRAIPVDTPAIVVALTSFNGAAAVAAAHAAGIDEYVRKPIDPDGFVELIRNVLGRK